MSPEIIRIFSARPSVRFIPSLGDNRSYLSAVGDQHSITSMCRVCNKFRTVITLCIEEGAEYKHYTDLARLLSDRCIATVATRSALQNTLTSVQGSVRSFQTQRRDL